MFRLALYLRVANPYVLEQLPWRVYKEWIDYFARDPFDELSLGGRIGFAAASLGNLLAKPKGRRGWLASDFMPGERKAEEAVGTSPTTQFNKLRMLSMQLGSKFIDKRDKKNG